MSINNKYFSETVVQPPKILDIGVIKQPVEIVQNTDSFGRVRVSLPMTEYEYNFQYSKAPLIWAEKITGTGVSTHLPNLSSIKMDTGSARTPALQKLVGYGDLNNGIFFGQDDTGLFFLLRSSISGAPSDARKVYQTNWNVDKFNGYGKSGVVIDITKTQIFVIDVQWLGVGTVRCGFEYNGILYYCHYFNNANLTDTVYTTTMNLPVHYSVIDGANSIIRQTYKYCRYRPGKSLQGLFTFNLFDKLTPYINQICCSILTETSGDAESYYQNSVNMGITPKPIGTTKTALISIRPKLLYNGLTNRGSIIEETVELVVSGLGSIRWELIYNPVLGGVPAYNSGGVNSLFEFDIAGTTVTGGDIIASGYVSSTAVYKGLSSLDVSAKYPLSLDIDGLNPKILTLCAVSFTGNVDTIASMTVKSYY